MWCPVCHLLSFVIRVWFLVFRYRLSFSVFRYRSLIYVRFHYLVSSLGCPLIYNKSLVFCLSFYRSLVSSYTALCPLCLSLKVFDGRSSFFSVSGLGFISGLWFPVFRYTDLWLRFVTCLWCPLIPYRSLVSGLSFNVFNGSLFQFSGFQSFVSLTLFSGFWFAFSGVHSLVTSIRFSGVLLSLLLIK